MIIKATAIPRRQSTSHILAVIFVGKWMRGSCVMYSPELSGGCMWYVCSTLKHCIDPYAKTIKKCPGNLKLLSPGHEVLLIQVFSQPIKLRTSENSKEEFF